MLADLHPDSLSDERRTDAGLADDDERSSFAQPAEVLQLPDLGFGDRSMIAVDEIREVDANRNFGGFQASPGGALAPGVGFGLQQCVEELGLAH